MPRTATKVVHINRHSMARNIKAGCNTEPVVTARFKHKKGAIRSNELHVIDNKGKVLMRILANVNKPLSCGARAYIETNLRIVNAEDPSQEL